MPRFAANLSTMFTEVPLRERFEVAARAGFEAVEVQEPYEVPAEFVKATLDHTDLELVLINVPGGDTGLAALPGSEDAFVASLGTAFDYATITGATRLHVMSGIRPPDIALEACEEVLTRNLKQASVQAASLGITLLIEPINVRDVPGYILSRQEQARRIVDAVDRENVRIQFDFYHCQVTHGDLTRHFTEQLPLIEHVQISDSPGRHEPGTGEINYSYIFELIDRSGYDGWVGAEYGPAGNTLDSLDWFTPWSHQSRG